MHSIKYVLLLFLGVHVESWLLYKNKDGERKLLVNLGFQVELLLY